MKLINICIALTSAIFMYCVSLNHNDVEGEPQLADIRNAKRVSSIIELLCFNGGTSVSDGVWILKIDSSNNVIEYRQFSRNQREELDYVAYDSSLHEITVMGGEFFNELYQEGLWMLKLDSGLTLIKSVDIIPKENSCKICKVRKLFNNNYMILGKDTSFQGWILMIDQDGKELWSYKDTMKSEYSDVSIDSNLNVYVVGSAQTEPYDSETTLFKFNQSGELLFSKALNVTAANAELNIDLISSDSLILILSNYIMLVDTLGNILYQNEYAKGHVFFQLYAPLTILDNNSFLSLYRDESLFFQNVDFSGVENFSVEFSHEDGYAFPFHLNVDKNGDYLVTISKNGFYSMGIEATVFSYPISADGVLGSKYYYPLDVTIMDTIQPITF